MNCDQRFDRLLLYTSGELTGSEIWELEAHIRECPDCAQRLASLQAAEDCVRETLSTPLATPDLTDLIMAQLPEPQRRVPVRRWQWAWTGACAAGVVVAAWGMSMWTGSEPVTLDHPSHHATTNTTPPVVAAKPAETNDTNDTAVDQFRAKVVKPKKPVRKPRPIGKLVFASISHGGSTDGSGGNPEFNHENETHNAVDTNIAVDNTSETTIPAVTVPASVECASNLVEKPVPVNKHEAWRPPLESEEDAAIMVELPHVGHGG